MLTGEACCSASLYTESVTWNVMASNLGFRDENESERGGKRKKGVVVRGISYTGARGWGERERITLLEGSEASSARPSDKSS
jgi:hypothetical protein